MSLEVDRLGFVEQFAPSQTVVTRRQVRDGRRLKVRRSISHNEQIIFELFA
ncbi:hypothetical protein [Natrinema soli]|uniref:hypothetical protein n=1 Tax=Natrinema soli TaxID=1930624 RepID=UPI00235FB0CE|nr:hypothetical protein [Natrinema soli]